MWWNISALRLPLVAAILFLVPALFTRKLPRFDNSLANTMLAFVVLATVSTIITGCDVIKIVPLDYLVTLVIVVLVSERLLGSIGTIFGLVVTAGLSLGFHSAKAGLSAIVSGGSYYAVEIGAGSFSGSNAFALGTAICIFYNLFLYQCLSNQQAKGVLPVFFQNSLVRLGFGGLILGMLLGSVYLVIATSSRGSALALAAGFLVWTLLHPKRIRVIFSICLCSVLILNIVSLPENYSERIESAFASGDEADLSVSSRPIFWKAARDMAAKYPLGVGLGCYPHFYAISTATADGLGKARSVHSSHYSVIAELGYLGFLLWCLLFWFCLTKLWKIRRKAAKRSHENSRDWFFFAFANAMISAQIVFLFGGSFYEMGYNDYTWMIFALVIAAERLYLKGETEQVSESNYRVTK